MSYYFGVDFDYEGDVTVDGEVLYVDLHAQLTAHVNLEQWTLDAIDGHIIADGDHIPLVGKPELEWAIRHFLKNDKTFREYADDHVREEYYDQVGPLR